MKIAVLSRNKKLYSTSRLVEAGEKLGHEMIVIDHSKCDLVVEQKKSLIYYQGELLTEVDAIIPRIGASITFYGAAVIRQFETMDVYTSLASQALVRSRDKLRSLQILSKAGIGLPRTIFTNKSEDFSKVINKIGGAPCVIKLLEGTQGIGVVLAETESAAISVLDAFQGLNVRVMVQEFIKESKATDIRAFVVGGEVIAAMKRKGKEGEFRSNLHRGGSAEVYELTEEERVTAIKAAKVLGLNVCGVDMLQSNNGPMVMEVNSSPGLEGIETYTGINVAEKIIKFIEKNIGQSGDTKHIY